MLSAVNNPEPRIPLTKNSHIIAVAGGSCSGKTTMARLVAEHLGPENCAIMYQDSYYLGLETITNYDLPEAIDFKLMAEHLDQLRNGLPIEMPCYDFTTHRRKVETQTLLPKPIILVDGILILHAQQLQKSFDYKIFVECNEHERRQRRLIRDIQERGRTEEETLRQFNEQVVPLHNELVEPSKHCADFICIAENDTPPAQLATDLLDYCKKIIV
ncbi:uridine kinase [Sessilibacter sp. MAH1]